MCVGLAKANKDILVNDRLVDGAASDGMLIISIIQCIISSAKADVMWSDDQFDCHCVCEQDYCRSDELISLKLGGMIGLTYRKN